MKKIGILLFITMGYMSGIFAQTPQVDIQLTVSTDVGDNQILSFGLDPSA